MQISKKKKVILISIVVVLLYNVVSLVGGYFLHKFFRVKEVENIVNTVVVDYVQNNEDFTETYGENALVVYDDEIAYEQIDKWRMWIPCEVKTETGEYSVWFEYDSRLESVTGYGLV